MAEYKTLWEAEVESTHQGDSDPADGSGKMIQVLVRTDSTPHILIRDAYKGPSGNFLNNPPTYGPSKSIEEELLDIFPRAFERARLYENAVEQFRSHDGITDERAIGLLDLVEDYADIEKIVALAED